MLLALRSLYERGVVVASQLEAFVLSDATARQLRRPASATEAASLGHSQGSLATVRVNQVESSSLDSSSTQSSETAVSQLESLSLASSWVSQLQAISLAQEGLTLSDGIPVVWVYRIGHVNESLGMEAESVSWGFKPIGIGAVASQPTKGMTGAVVSFLGIQATVQVGAAAVAATSGGIQVSQVGFFIPEEVYLKDSWGTSLTDGNGNFLFSNYTPLPSNTLFDSWGSPLYGSQGNPLFSVYRGT